MTPPCHKTTPRWWTQCEVSTPLWRLHREVSTSWSFWHQHQNWFTKKNSESRLNPVFITGESRLPGLIGTRKCFYKTILVDSAVATTPVCRLRIWITPSIFDKIRNPFQTSLTGPGEIVLWKKGDISWHSLFNKWCHCTVMPRCFKFIDLNFNALKWFWLVFSSLPRAWRYSCSTRLAASMSGSDRYSGARSRNSSPLPQIKGIVSCKIKN